MFTARPPRSRRRTWPGSRRGIALGLSLLLVGAALAAPAAAEDELKTFEAVVDGTLAEAPDRFDLTVTLTNTTAGGDGLQLGSANIVIPAGLTIAAETVRVDPEGSASAKLNGDILEARRLGLAPGGDDPGEDSKAVISFRATVDDCDADTAYGFEAAAKQSNNFRGTGNDLELSNPAALTIDLDCAPAAPAYTDGLDEACTSGHCRLEAVGGGQTFTAAATGPDEASLQIGVRSPGDEEFAVPGAIAEAFSEQCQEFVDNPSLTGGQEVRLANAIFQFEPSKFEKGQQVTIDMVIPKSIVNQSQNRSADAFGVCFLGDEDAFSKWNGSVAELFSVPNPEPDGEPIPASDLDGSVPELFGPVLLPMCADGFGAPCIERREKVRSDVHITVLTPAEDPWMR